MLLANAKVEKKCEPSKLNPTFFVNSQKKCNFVVKNVTTMNNFRRFFLLIMFFYSLFSAAVPVQRTRTLLRLADGTKVYATAMGDEHLSFFVTDEGRVVTQTQEGFVLTAMTVEEYVQSMERLRNNSPRKVGSSSTALLQQHGTKHVPLLLVSFADKDFIVASDSAGVNSYYDLYCNGEHYKGHGSTGSVRDYYQDMSQGDFLPEFTVIGPLKLDNGYAHYGKDSGSTKDVNYNAFLREAFSKATECFEDWSHFDNDGNGTVDMVMVIFAGMGQNYTNSLGITDVIWPKEMPSYIECNGIKFSGCSSTSETIPYAMQGSQVLDKPDGIGNFLHEMNHALGLPDFYDTRYVAFGMDYWDIMDYGGYVNNGYSPVNMSAYEREFMGWQPIEELTGPCTLRLSCFAEGGHGYKVVNRQNPNEYYVLENRQSKGWDDKLCKKFGSGMMVTHIDYLQSAWTGNRVNTDPNHQRLTIIPANNTLIGANNSKSQDEYTNSMKGNLYPGTSLNYELTDESTPASTVFTGGYMGKPIYDIQMHADGTVTLKYMPLGVLPQPSGIRGYDTSLTEASLEWDEVENAEAYNIRIFAEGKLEAEVDSLNSNIFNLNNLREGVSYSFSVQAIAGEWRNSSWAEGQLVRDVEDALSALPAGNEVVTVYTMDGSPLTECRTQDVNAPSLGHGVFVMKNKNGKTKKIIL